MERKLRIAICGYGNLGRGVEKAIAKTSDMELVAVFTRRDPGSLTIASKAKVVSIAEIGEWQNDIDVLIMCGGSATDLPVQVPTYAGVFNTIDSFDTHAKIPEFFKEVDIKARGGNKISIISDGWDPGLFSKMRLEADSILPDAYIQTFWGDVETGGISQGHSDAIRRIDGVKDARQYTVPIKEAMDAVRRGENPELSTGDKHRRVCYVVAEEGADLERIKQEIVTMPYYFDEYETEVNFISEEELLSKHGGMPHGGSVIACGTTGEGNKEVMEYKLDLDSNPEFTGSVLVAYARAAYKMEQMGMSGAKTIFDVAPAWLSTKTQDDMLKLL